MSSIDVDKVSNRLKLRELYLLKTVGEAGSMAQAAARLGLSQSAVSKAITELERLIGSPLLDRLPRGVALTDCGRILVDSSGRALDELREGIREIGTLSDSVSGVVRIGTTEAMAGNVAVVIREVFAQTSAIHFEVNVGDTSKLILDLRERKIDIVWTRWTSVLAADDLAVERLFQAPLVVMAHRDHPLVGRKKIEPSTLLRERWTLSPPDSFLGQLVTEAFSAVNCPLPVAPITTMSIYMRLNLVASGDFLTVLPRTMLDHPANKGWLSRLRVNLGAEKGTISLIWLARRRESNAVKLFRRIATHAVKSV